MVDWKLVTDSHGEVMPRKEPLLGFLHGTGDHEGERVAVYKAGRTYRLSYGDRRHLCHPSVTSIQKAKAETYVVFLVKVDAFTPA